MISFFYRFIQQLFQDDQPKIKYTIDYQRCSGILLPIFSLPGKYGIGSIGQEAYEFIDFLYESKQKLWSILPLGSTDNNCPYSGTSSIAGNPYLIDLESLVKAGWLNEQDLQIMETLNPQDQDDTVLRVNYQTVKQQKTKLLDDAWKQFKLQQNDQINNQKWQEFQTFCEANKEWLDDFAIFTAIKDSKGGQPWWIWEKQLKEHDMNYINQYVIKELEQGIQFIKFQQYLFFSQWSKLKQYAESKDIKIQGDMPIYVEWNSADVWANTKCFLLDKNFQPIFVSGVPPDKNFPAQIWGHPIYDWEYQEKTGFEWWCKRIKYNKILYHIIRIDHFIGLANYWSIPFNQQQNIKYGKWRNAPGFSLFKTLYEKFGKLNFIVEDLGTISKRVRNLKEQFGFPGMIVLQNINYVQNNAQNAVVFTGTHDNNTTVGWVKRCNQEKKKKLIKLLKCNEDKICNALVEKAFMMNANLCVIQMQDLLELGEEARMNLPGTVKDENWSWLSRPKQFSNDLKLRLAELSARSNRY